MRYTVIFLCTAALIIMFLPGCSNSPKQLGLGLVAPQDTITQLRDTTLATSDTTFLKRIGGSTSSLFGSLTDPHIASRALFQFVGFTSLPDTAQIDSAVVALPINYKFHSNYESYPLELIAYMYELDTTWSYTAFSWDSSENLSWKSKTPIDTLRLLVNESDSVISIRIDSLVQKWVANQTYAPHGIILIPDTNFSQIIIGQRTVANVDLHPSLTVRYHSIGDTTKTFTTASIQETFVANGAVPSSATTMTLQAGISFRGLIRFDSLSLPKRVSINKALIEFSVDESASMLTTTTIDSFYAHILLANSTPYDSLALGTLCTRVTSATQRTYQADIKNIVQQWVVRNSNYGIIIRPYGEYIGFDRFAVYGASAAVSLRPKITITYSVLP